MKIIFFLVFLWTLVKGDYDMLMVFNMSMLVTYILAIIFNTKIIIFFSNLFANGSSLFLAGNLLIVITDIVSRKDWSYAKIYLAYILVLIAVHIFYIRKVIK